MNISIIIPVLNEAERLEYAIERAWAAGAAEVIVSDGGSSDDSKEVAKNCRCQLVEGPPGRAIQQNRAAAVAEGDVLLFLHADTWLAEGTAAQIEAALATSVSKVVGGAFRQNIEARGLCFRLLEFGNALRVRVLRLPYGDQGIFVRREIFESLGGFPEIPLMEDLRFMRKLRRKHRIALLEGPLHVSARRWQKHGVLRQTLRNWGILTAEKLGVSPDRLSRHYANHSPERAADSATNTVE